MTPCRSSGLLARAIIAAIGLSILVGIAGQLSLAHAFFVAIGAYGYAYLADKIPPVLAMVAAVLLAGLAGALFSPIAGRVRGIYLGLASLGLVFLHASGTLQEMTLAPGEVLRVDTGCMVAMEQTVDYDIQMVPGVKTALFGGEGLFFVQLTGPGRVILQTLPFSRLADRIIAASPRAGGRRVGEGSVLGALGGLLDGDNG